MKVNITKSLSYIVDFITVNGFYVIIMIFSLLNLDIESRFYTIPTRLIVVVSMIILMVIKRYKPCHDTLVYLFFAWFFVFYCFRIIMEIIKGSQITYFTAPYEYLLYLIIYCLFPFLYFSQRRTEAGFEQIFRAILVSGILFSVIIIIMFFKSLKFGRFDRYLIGISPLTVSYVGSLITGMCFSRLVFNPRFKNSSLLLFGLVIGMCPLLIGGSRGPILALIIPLIFGFYYKIRKLFNPKVILYGLLATIILFIALYIFGNIALTRVANIFTDLTHNTSDASRLFIWKSTIKQFLQSPLWGDSIQLKVFEYPHNLSLEVLMSTGIIGYIPFLIMMCFGIYKAIRILKYFPSYIWLYTFFFQTLIMGMLSGNVYSDIWYWTSLAMIFAVDLRKIENSSYPINTASVYE